MQLREESITETDALYSSPGAAEKKWSGCHMQSKKQNSDGEKSEV